MQRPIRRMRMSFNKEEITRSMLSAGIGISMPISVLGVENGNFSREAFGMFGGSGDGNKFFPGINIPEDVMPKPEDFIEVPFRLISATIVAGGTWRATDFSRPGVLQKSVKKLDNKPVYKDHDTDLDNWIGSVSNPKWTESFRDGDVQVPAGIDGIIRIDAKTNPKIARGVLSGGIFSNSVTIDFDWVPSHDIPNEYEFEDRVGTYAEDGRMICREVVRVYDYYESSLCWLGADPYAKMINNDGSLVHIDITSTYDQENETVRNSYKKEGRYSITRSFDKNVLSLSKLNFKDGQSNHTNKKEMEKILEALRAKLGLAKDAEVTPDMIAKLQVEGGDASKQVTGFLRFAKVQAVSASSDEAVSVVNSEGEVAENVGEQYVFLKKDEFTALKDGKKAYEALGTGEDTVTVEKLNKLKEEAAKVVTLSKEVDTLKAEKSSLTDQLALEKPFADEGRANLELKRDEAIRLYKLSAGDKASTAVEELFKKAEPKALEGLLTQYASGMTAKFGGRCTDCGSSNFEFKSSLGTGAHGVQTDTVVEEDSSDFYALVDEFSNQSLFGTDNSQK